MCSFASYKATKYVPVVLEIKSPEGYNFHIITFRLLMFPRSKRNKRESIALDIFKVQIDKFVILKSNNVAVPSSRLICYLKERGSHASWRGNVLGPKTGQLYMLTSSVPCISDLQAFGCAGSFLTTQIEVTNES